MAILGEKFTFNNDPSPKLNPLLILIVAKIYSAPDLINIKPFNKSFMSMNELSGYVLLNMPTDQVQPLGFLTLGEKGSVNTTGGHISNLFIQGEIPVPLVSEDHNLSAEMDKSVSLEVSVDSRFSLLEGLLKFLKLSGSFKLQKNKSVKVHLHDAKKNVVNEFELDAYINSSKLNRPMRSFIEMLQKNELYVITDVLKCKKYTLEYSNTKTTDAELKFESGQVGDGGGEMHTDNTSNDTFTNEGDHYITLCVKAYRIYYIKDKKTGEESYRIRKADEIKTVLDDEDFPGEMLTAKTITVIPEHETA